MRKEPHELSLETLRRDFGGDIIEPGAAEYESASRSLFASGSPAYVLRPQSVGDVQAGVRFATRSGLVLSVRGGGHGFPGFGTNDGGVVIDLSNLAGVEIVDEEQHLVRVGGGATWGQVAAALAPHGLAISSGDTKSVGVGGLTLTGGIGWKVRKYGLALDNVVAAEVVLANGTVVQASATENPELFWAIRGGGGNFGIVTSFEFAAHPTTDVFYGKITFPASEAAGVLQGWADYLRSAPDELTSVVNLANPAAGGPEAPLEVYVAFDGDDPELAADAIDPIRRLGTVIDDDVALTPYADTLADGAIPPPGIRVRDAERLRRKGLRAGGAPDRCQGRDVEGVTGHQPAQRQRCRIPSPRRRHRLRAPAGRVDARDAHRGPEAGRRGGGADAGRDVGKTGTSRQGRLCELLDLGHRGGCRRGLPDGDLQAARGDQAPVRPRQPVRSQPQRPAVLVPIGRRRRLTVRDTGDPIPSTAWAATRYERILSHEHPSTPAISQMHALVEPGHLGPASFRGCPARGRVSEKEHHPMQTTQRIKTMQPTTPPRSSAIAAMAAGLALTIVATIVPFITSTLARPHPRRLPRLHRRVSTPP